MGQTRIRCTVCGFRLNKGALDREIDFEDGKDVIEQEFGGRGVINTVNSSNFENDEETELLYQKVKKAFKYLSDVLDKDEVEWYDDEENEGENDE